MKYFFLLPISIFVFGCVKDKAQKPYQNGVDNAVFVGVMRIEQNGASGSTTWLHDTSYIDSIKFTNTNNSVNFFFQKRNYNYPFSNSNYYLEWEGTQENHFFKFRSTDSIEYSLWSYGGGSGLGGFSEINSVFRGKKR